MLIYISMFFLSILFIYFANKQNDARRKNVLYVLSFMPFFLVSAFRYGVGTDYLRRYSLDFVKIYQGYSVNNLEIGFILLNKLTMLITNKPFLMFFITSFLINGFIFWTICKESKDKILSICIFFLLGFFFNSLNIMRQYSALSFIFIGFYYLLRNKKILFLLSVIIASFFHSSAFVMLALVICDYKVIANYKWFIPVVIVVLCLNSNLMDILEFVLKNTRFNVYFSGKLFKGEVSYLFI